jgi:hypothetical protein
MVIAVLLLGVTGGCKVTGDDIEYWKGTVKGPRKILAVLLSDKYPMELRTEAAMALVEMRPRQQTQSYDKVDGVEVLRNRAFPELETETRVELIDRMVPELKKLMKEGGSSDEKKEGKGPPPIQVRAKDAAFYIIKYGSPSDKARSQLMDSLMSWYVEDFNGRFLKGRTTAKQAVEDFGAPAAKQLVDALNSHMPQQALVKIAELIKRWGDDAAQKRAAKRLVEIEKEMESDKFIGWLEDNIRKELKRQNDGEVEEERVQAVALLNRHKWINEGAIPAMKHLASRDVAADRLMEIATGKADDKAMKKHRDKILKSLSDKRRKQYAGELAKRWVDRRQRALQALEGNAKEEYLDDLLKLALNEDNPAKVRAYAFDRIGDTGSKKALPKLWPLVEKTGNPSLRGTAGELCLSIGGADVVGKFFSKLPEEEGVEYAREELTGYAKRLSQMSPPPTEMLRGQLKSSDWWDRVIALRYLERRGTKDDVSRIEKLAGDKAKATGPNWQKGATVGKVAEQALEGLKERVSEGDGQDKPAEQGE